MALPTAQRRHWIFSADPHHYHWDTLFVKGKEMWHGAAGKQDAIRALKQVRKGDRVLCYHSAPERSLYSIAEVTRDPYPDPHDPKEKNLVADLRAFERLPRQVTLTELRENRALRKMKIAEERAGAGLRRLRKRSTWRFCGWRGLWRRRGFRCRRCEC